METRLEKAEHAGLASSHTRCHRRQESGRDRREEVRERLSKRRTGSRGLVGADEAERLRRRGGRRAGWPAEGHVRGGDEAGTMRRQPARYARGEVGFKGGRAAGA